MSIIGLLVAVALVGFIAWLVLQIPMPEPFPKIIIAVLVVVLILYILQAFGLITGIGTLRIK